MKFYPHRAIATKVLISVLTFLVFLVPSPTVQSAGIVKYDDPYGLLEYYGLDINIGNGKTSFTIGSPAIQKYFKLKASRHKGLFVITTSGVYFTPTNDPKLDQSCVFYKIYLTYGNGWSNESKPCPGKFYKSPKFCVYPCEGGKVSYKIREGDVEIADEYKF